MREGGNVQKFQNVQKHKQLQNKVNGAGARIPPACTATNTKISKIKHLFSPANEDGPRGISANQRRARSELRSDGGNSVDCINPKQKNVLPVLPDK